MDSLAIPDHSWPVVGGPARSTTKSSVRHVGVAHAQVDVVNLLQRVLIQVQVKCRDVLLHPPPNRMWPA